MMPYMAKRLDYELMHLVSTVLNEENIPLSVNLFNPPTQNHEVTYTQVARLYAAADLQIHDTDILITSDCDMAVFEIPPHTHNGAFSIFGHDLCAPKQYPICYISATAAAWRKTFVKGRSLQDCLDDALAAETCESMAGNLWCRDQETAFNLIEPTKPNLHKRAKEGTQFATHRCDRDDAYWHDHVTPSLVDAHLWRPGFAPENTEKIIGLLTIMYPNTAFDWLWKYAEDFRKLVK
jgi:hypothetical protein